MFDVILAPTDGSEHATRAMGAAIDLAAKYRARFIVLHVLLHHATAQEVEHILEGAEINREIRAEIRGLRNVSAPIPVGGSRGRDTPSQALAERVGAHVVDLATERAKAAGVQEVTPVVVAGSPGKQIIDVAKREKVQLLVMGVRGLGGLQSLLHGSVSQSVRSACHCACLTIP